MSRMKNTITLFPLILALAIFWSIGCGDAPQPSETIPAPKQTPAAEPKGPLMVHVGGTMKPVMQQLAKDYEAATGQKIEINSAGSGELLAHIELQKEGDIYVCHDPFLDILMQGKKLGVDGWIMAELTPVIVVPKGNPKQIKGVADLARPDVELFLTDYRYSTLGRMVGTIFSKVNIDLEKLKKEKEIATHKSGGYAANMVMTGNADASMVWNAVGHLRLDALDIVKIVPEHLPEPDVDTVTSATNKEYALTPVLVTAATLKCSDQPKASAKFAEFITSKQGSKTFTDFGFTMGMARKAYENGKLLPE